jgi:hypothetical protein
MTDSPVIRIVGTNCGANQEEEGNAWYTTHHVPLVLHGTARGNERHQRIGDDGAYPKYLAIYEYENEAALNDYLRSPLYIEALQDVRESYPEKGSFTVIWSVNYRRVAKRGSAADSLAFTIVGTNCPRNADEYEFNEWYTNDHMVFVLRSPFVIRAERYQRIGDDGNYPKYLAIYRYENERGLEDNRNTFISRLAIPDRRKRWPDDVWDRPWMVSYKLISKERKDLVV